jgi:hypothetical protein
MIIFYTDLREANPSPGESVLSVFTNAQGNVTGADYFEFAKIRTIFGKARSFGTNVLSLMPPRAPIEKLVFLGFPVKGRFYVGLENIAAACREEQILRPYASAFQYEHERRLAGPSFVHA